MLEVEFASAPVISFAKQRTRGGQKKETVHYPMDPPDPIEAIKFRMEQQGLTRKDLEGIIGTRARIAEVLDRKRSLSIAMIRRLHEQLGIPAEILIRPLRRTAA